MNDMSWMSTEDSECDGMSNVGRWTPSSMSALPARHREPSYVPCSLCPWIGSHGRPAQICSYIGISVRIRRASEGGDIPGTMVPVTEYDPGKR